MTKTFYVLIVASLMLPSFINSAFAGSGNVVPDSVYLLSYATTKNSGRNGLHFAWSRDKERWFLIGNERSFLKSEYGHWETDRKMIDPFLYRSPNGVWHCVWSLNDHDKLVAHTTSDDLVNWSRQDYLPIAGENCIKPILIRVNADLSAIEYGDRSGNYYQMSSVDLKHFTSASKVSPSYDQNTKLTVNLPGGNVNGQIHKVSWLEVQVLIADFERRQYQNSLYSETTVGDSQRFSRLKSISADIVATPSTKIQVSDRLIGVFFEDISYAADGGLYGELLQNRDFEYNLADKRGRDKKWNNLHSWSLNNSGSSVYIDSINPIHPNNPHYVILETQTPGAVLSNSGFDGIGVKKNERYVFSVFSKNMNKGKSSLKVQLVDPSGNSLGIVKVDLVSSKWNKTTYVITATSDAENARLEIVPLSSGKIGLDMISLFPEKTFKNRKNGLRADLAQTIADIHPRFVRFPGGCVAHGDGLDNIYPWKNTIGPLEARKPMRNMRDYHQTLGLGYFEYFQFCEDLGAEPIPVIAAGVACQYYGSGPKGGGQQGGIPMEQMDEFVQDVLDLVEYANGPATSFWGRKRAEAGHPKSFNLKYIGIGNEDMISDVFEERFKMIFEAVKKTHPEITIIGTAGSSTEGTDYQEGWRLARKENIPMVDEHYYASPGWFIYNQNFYDSYDRTQSKVFLGEYAAHFPGRKTNLETALAEALYLTALERNGDIVQMAAYAPLLAREGHIQWEPNLIYFNSYEVKTTVGYEVQKLFGQNSGTEYVPSVIKLSESGEAVSSRFAVSVVNDIKSGDIIIKAVNLLPVQIDAKFNILSLKLTGSENVSKISLSGNPSDKLLKPVTNTLISHDLEQEKIQPYSFVVYRISKMK